MRPGFDAEERIRGLRGLTHKFGVWGWMKAAGSVAAVEDSYIFSDAMLAYRNGADAASIFCSHAAAERLIASHLDHSPDPPANYLRWGLGKFVEHLDKQGAPTDIVESLTGLNGDRKSLYHWGRESEANALLSRAMGLAEDVPGVVEKADSLYGRAKPKYVLQTAIDMELERTALRGMEAYFKLSGWLN